MEPSALVIVKKLLFLFKFAPVTISANYLQLYGSCGTDNTCVSTSHHKNEWSAFTARIKIKLSVKLRRNGSDTRAMLSEAYREGAMKSKVLLSGINGSKTTGMSKSQMKKIISSSFDTNYIVHFELKMNQTIYAGILKRLRETVLKRKACICSTIRFYQTFSVPNILY